MPIAVRPVAPAIVALLCGLLLVGCTSSETDSGPVNTEAGELSKFYDQTPTWSSCDEFETDAPLPSRLECARITVPIDYDAPDGATAEIAISRERATGDKIGSLLLNPGGPGGSGLSMATRAGGTPIADRFDVIGFDPRGVGASTPAVRCTTAEQADAERADLDTDMSPIGIDQTEREDRDYIAGCVGDSGDDLLAHIGTREVVRDLDIMRAVLGDEQLNFLGYSYGTRIGAAYAEQFPQRVRALVLDGAVLPDADPSDDTVAQAAGFQGAFDDYARDCAAVPACPLGQDPTQAVAAYRALVSPLADHPAATTDPRGLGYNDAITGTVQALYSPDQWRTLTAALRELARGHGDTLLQLADISEGRDDEGEYSNLNDAFNAIRCVDDPRVTDRAVAGDMDTRYRAAAPFLDDGRGTGSAPLDLCAQWPVPATSTPHRSEASGLPPVVVVSTTNDPATPYPDGVALADQLGGSLITYRGTQHTVTLSGVACVDDAVADYLVSLTPPPDGLTC
ncbi:alpha/beta hydrolase [Aldersonia sp. NBC_00410]|uniref:alpha/beta hydrolase n=1 Tax=Aldersonia sp. NBC_00410 TaxID=2975954 RepID=UPI00224E08AA|nr:alpha/beta hydrolase [Aldersonia sp. NBC_00410]MCX5042631.1 alpha/beta hydrolase [Aldersonia sp. NBC_00410]